MHAATSHLPRALPQFLPSARDGLQRFGLLHQPGAGSAVRGRVLFIHAFAEEMNKARRMAALQAQALARAGFWVLQIDLLGCGDSDGDFGDASWVAWQDDVRNGAEQLRHCGSSPLWLWGMRAGALLAAEVAPQLPEPAHCLFWQPASSGKQLLQQFLRLKTASGLISGQGKGAMAEAQAQLDAGASVEVAGYQLPAALAKGLEKSRLTPPALAEASPPRHLLWFELSTQAEASFSPVAQQAHEAWRAAGWQLEAAMLQGPQFWQTTEIEEAPALLAATLAAMERHAG